MDPVAAAALAAFGLERSFQLLSYLIIQHRAKDRTWIDELVAQVNDTTSAPLNRAQARRLADWLRTAPVWEHLLGGDVDAEQLTHELADVVYLAHQPRPGVDLHERLDHARHQADQILADLATTALRSMDPATATTVLASRLAHQRSRVAYDFLQVLADDHITLLQVAETHHRELLDTLAALAPPPAAPREPVASYPPPPNEPTVTTPAFAQLRAAGVPPGTITALVGSNGTGKTFIARHIAHHHAQRHETVWWIRAADRTVAERDLIALGHAAGLTKPDPTTVLAHLAGLSDPWLLVFDDAPPPAEILDLVPTSAGGAVLITTNHHHWHEHAATTTVGLWDHHAATTYLAPHGTDATEAELASAERIVDALGHHPLACAQAARFCRQSGTSLPAYETLLESSRAAVLDAEIAIPPGYDRTVLWAWAAAVDTTEQHHPAALDLLDVFSWVAPEPLPLDALTLADPRALFGTDTPVGVLAAVLVEISLLDRFGDTVTCHRLIQIATQLLHTTTTPGEGLARAASLLNQTRPPDMATTANRARYAELLPHALSIVGHADHHPVSRDVIDLGFNFVVFLRSEGQLQVAHDLALTLQRLAANVETPEPASALVWDRQLALSYEDIGDEATATELLVAALERASHQLAPTDPSVLRTNIELGRLLAVGTDHDQALDLHRNALEGLRAALGDDHDDTMDARRWLAVTERRAGNPDRAVHLHQQIEDWYTRTGGRGDLSRLINQSTMVMALTDAGHLDRAIDLGTTTVTAATTGFGPDHSETLAALDNLARAQILAGDPDAAIAARTLILDTRTQHLPRDHPLVLQSRANLATALSAGGRTDEAIELERDNVELFTRRYGPDHPATWTSQNNLATSLLALGHPQEATRLFERVLERRRNALGPDHPAALLAEYNYLRAADAPDERLAAFVDRLDALIGADTVLTSTARINRAEVLLEAGRTTEARAEAQIVADTAPSQPHRDRAQAIIDLRPPPD